MKHDAVHCKINTEGLLWYLTKVVRLSVVLFSWLDKEHHYQGWEETNLSNICKHMPNIRINAFKVVPWGGRKQMSVGKIQMLDVLFSTHLITKKGEHTL